MVGNAQNAMGVVRHARVDLRWDACLVSGSRSWCQVSAWVVHRRARSVISDRVARCVREGITCTVAAV